MPDYIARRLPRHHWKLLRPVPAWDGVLYYDPLDIQLDRPLTIFRRLNHRRLGEIRYPLMVYTEDRQISNRKKRMTQRPRFQRTIKIYYKGVTVHLTCSQLTMHCIMGFTIADPRHWVVDHINGDSTDDRPSNLQVITQSENCARSEAIREQARKIGRLCRGKSNAQRHAEAMERRMERMRELENEKEKERELKIKREKLKMK